MSGTLMLRSAHIALGSNVGDRHGNLNAAIAALAAVEAVTVIRVANAIETAPVDCPPGSLPFLNSAAELATTLEPHALLAALHAVEISLGRERPVRNAPRTIDLDLLLFGDRIIDSPGLTLPHPRLHERRFVLAPLASVAPRVMHPTLGRTIEDLLRELDRTASRS